MKRKMLSTVLALALVLLPVKYVDAKASPIQDTYICAEYQKYIYEISDYFNICPELIEAIIESESSGNAEARNGGCKGLMQINESAHKERMKKYGLTNLYDPFTSIFLGCDYLAELFEEYEDVGSVLIRYNGDSRIKKYENTGELTKYAERILERSAELEELHYSNKN